MKLSTLTSFVFSLFIVVLSFEASAQARPVEVISKDENDFFDNVDRATIGVGLGQKFGGIGLSGTYYASPNVGMFLGVGYAMAGTGVNAGIKLRTLSEKLNARGYFVAMYGYNAALAVLDNQELSKLFYGASIGAGVDLFNPFKQGYWTLGIILPFRSDKVEEYKQMLEDDHGIQFQNDLLPITFTIGYHFAIN